MSQVRTVTLRVDNDSVDLDKVLDNLVVNNPGLTVSTWKKKGKHKKTEAVLESVAN